MRVQYLYLYVLYSVIYVFTATVLYTIIRSLGVLGRQTSDVLRHPPPGRFWRHQASSSREILASSGVLQGDSGVLRRPPPGSFWHPQASSRELLASSGFLLQGASGVLRRPPPGRFWHPQACSSRELLASSAACRRLSRISGSASQLGIRQRLRSPSARHPRSAAWK